MAKIRVKICGLSAPDHVAAAADAGAAYLGFTFISRSVRAVSPDLARDLALAVPPGVAKVALTLDASDAELEHITSTVPLDMIQLHGSETEARVSEVRARWGLPVMKAVGVGTADDLAKVASYSAVADQILVDAKPPKNEDLPGGNGVAFDWNLLSGHRWSTPWMLAGGLNAQNVGEAVRATGARQVDVSSGVETSPGHKDASLIRDFIHAASDIALADASRAKA